MKHQIHIFVLVFGILLFQQHSYGQVDFNKRPDDDLGNVEDAYQEAFFEALKQKGIENYQRAIDALLKCESLDDTDAALYFELGKNYKQLKNFGAAESSLKEALSKQPENEWFLDELYDVYIQQNDIDKAVKTVKQLVKYHPDYKQDLAGLYIKAKKYKNALEILDALDSKLGINEDRDYMRNQIYNITGKDEDRIENLEKRVADSPNNETNYLTLIYRYSESGEKVKAFNTAKKLLEIKPESELVHLALYKFYLESDDTQNAISSMKIVLKSAQINADAKAKVLNDFVSFVSRHPEHESDLLEATTIVDANENSKSLLELAQYYLKSNDKVKALTYYNQVLKQEPNNFNVIKDVLLLQLDLNMNAAAESKSTEVLELFPAQPILYLINGVANNKLKHSKKAIESLETGLVYLVDDIKMEGDFYTQLSLAHEIANNISKSKAFAKKAEALKQ
ncbi:hypothetical protein A9Q87_03805 [Flavobacteriales bacterium 34_180_T64]|nr:hypothetical protein A9Q87_03805 [Flavobacteriales bacterium 34_180_T64]